jgi:hypothetical protein
MKNQTLYCCDLWTLPDLWKAPPAFPTSAHRPWRCLSLFFESLESMKGLVQY